MVTVTFQITNKMAKEIEYTLGREYGEYDKQADEAVKGL